MMVMIVNNSFRLSMNKNQVTIRTMMYPDVNLPSPEISNEEIFQAKGDLMKSIQTFLERFNCIPFEEKPQILFQTWETFFAIQCSQPEDSNELFQKLLKDLKKLAENDQSTRTDRPIFLNNEDHPVQNRESPENSSEENVFLCMHDDIDNLIKNALDSKFLSINSINSQRLNKKDQEVKNVEEQQAGRRNLVPILSTREPENSLSMGYEHLSITPETESDEVTESNAKNHLPIPSECEVTSEDKRERDELICDNHSDTFSDSKIDDDISVCDDDFEDIEYIEASLLDPEIASIEEENGVEEENVVQREEEEVEDISQVQDVVLREKLLSITRLISNIKSLNDNSTPDRVFNSFEFDNSLLDNYSLEFKTFCDHSEEARSDNTTHANYSLPEYDSFCFEIEPDQERLINLVENDIPNNSSNDPLLEEVNLFLSDDSIPPGIENVADDPEGDVRFLEELIIDDFILFDESSDSNFKDNRQFHDLLRNREADLFLSDNLIPPGIEHVADDPEGDVRFLEELLINDSILSHESSDSNFKDSPLIPRPPPEPPDNNFDLEPEVISAVMEDIDEPDEHFNPGGEIFVSTNNEDVNYFVIRIFLPYLILPKISPLLLSAESEDTIFDPGLSLGD
nr:hypothetical protein [Tanacetum cinerariifolium]